MSRWVLVLRLSKWPILLDIAAVSLGVGSFISWSVFHAWFVALPVAFASLLVLTTSIKLHFGTGHRLRAWKQLVARNRRDFKPDSFEIFMMAPCGRDLVHAVLTEVGYVDQYTVLRGKYYSGFWGKYDPSPLRFVPYQDQEREPND